jgi:thymidylate kinase
MTRGLLITVEGMDNAGKTTFCDEFVKTYPLTQRIKLPTPEIYNLIEQCPREMWHNLFHENIVSVMKKIGEHLSNGQNVICDRYIYSHFVYEAMTSKIICEFKSSLKPDAIVYFIHKKLNGLPKKDTMEKLVDVEEGQRYFDKLFKNVNVPVIYVPALQKNSNTIAFTYLKELFGKRLYIP